MRCCAGRPLRLSSAEYWLGPPSNAAQLAVEPKLALCRSMPLSFLHLGCGAPCLIASSTGATGRVRRNLGREQRQQLDDPLLKQPGLIHHLWADLDAGLALDWAEPESHHLEGMVPESASRWSQSTEDETCWTWGIPQRRSTHSKKYSCDRD